SLCSFRTVFYRIPREWPVRCKSCWDQGTRYGYTALPQVAVLADTAFNAESVDEVAAQHMSADCVVQFGRSSLAPTAHIPAIHAVCVSAAAQCVQEGLDTATRALLKRRYFLVEKAREASLVGILVGTTASPGLAQAMAALRRLIKAAGKQGRHL
ncbi:uncharacterized protein HaLaN_00745, partial [Haematococcus lacustris]